MPHTFNQLVLALAISTVSTSATAQGWPNWSVPPNPPVPPGVPYPQPQIPRQQYPQQQYPQQQRATPPTRSSSSISPVKFAFGAGLHADSYKLTAASDSINPKAGGLAAHMLFHLTDGPSSVVSRISLSADLSVGNEGLTGLLPFDIGWGYMADLGSPDTVSHGPFFRLGTAIIGAGNNQNKLTFWELPTLNLGYTINEGDNFGLELSARGGVLLTGGYSIGEDFYMRDSRRRIDPTPDYGAGATLFAGPVVLDLTGFRAKTEYGTKSTLEYGHGLACVGYIFLVCAEGMTWKSDVAPVPTLTPWVDSRATYLGITLGVGIVGGGLSAVKKSPIDPPWLPASAK